MRKEPLAEEDVDAAVRLIVEGGTAGAEIESDATERCREWPRPGMVRGRAGEGCCMSSW